MVKPPSEAFRLTKSHHGDEIAAGCVVQAIACHRTDFLLSKLKREQRTRQRQDGDQASLQRQGFPLTGGEVGEVVGAELGAVEGGDFVALAGKHAAHLVVATFGEAESGGGGAGEGQLGREAGLGLAAEQDGAAGKHGDERGVELAVHGDLVDFFEIGLGRGVAMNERAEVGDEDEAAGFFVEPTDAGDGGMAVEPLLGQQFVDVAAFGLTMGAAVADRFVEHDEQAVRGFQRLLIKGDVEGIGFLIGPSGEYAVEVDAAFADVSGDVTAGAVAERGEELVEAAHGDGGERFDRV